MSTDDTYIYGGEQTIHGSDYVTVTTNKEGKVLRVEFRCMFLPFDQVVGEEEPPNYIEAQSDYGVANYLPYGIVGGCPQKHEGFITGIRGIIFRERPINKKPRTMLDYDKLAEITKHLVKKE